MGLFNIFKRPAEPAVPASAPVGVVPSPPTKTAPISASVITGVLVRRLVTEKATAGAKLAQSVFVVARDANKMTIRQAVQQRYGVAPLQVRILNVRGHRVHFGRRQGETKSWKKAIVTMPEGTNIESEKPAS